VLCITNNIQHFSWHNYVNIFIFNKSIKKMLQSNTKSLFLCRNVITNIQAIYWVPFLAVKHLIIKKTLLFFMFCVTLLQKHKTMPSFFFYSKIVFISDIQQKPVYPYFYCILYSQFNENSKWLMCGVKRLLENLFSLIKD
jgi:hypothetical protein